MHDHLRPSALTNAQGIGTDHAAAHLPVRFPQITHECGGHIEGVVSAPFHPKTAGWEGSAMTLSGILTVAQSPS